MSWPQCTELEATSDFQTFEGRSMRRFVKGQRVWVTNPRHEQDRLGTVALARKGRNAASAQYWSMEDAQRYFREPNT